MGRAATLSPPDSQIKYGHFRLGGVDTSNLSTAELHARLAAAGDRYGPCMALGQAAGTAAALAEHGDVGQLDPEPLRDRLENDGVILAV